MLHSHELMGGSRWRTPTDQWKKQAGHIEQGCWVLFFFMLRKFGGKSDITVYITVFPFDASPPHPSVCVFCLLSSLWSCAVPKRFASVRWPVWIQQSDFFPRRKSTVYFFCYSGEWQKIPNWAHKVAAQIRRRGITPTLRGNLIAQALQRPSFTQFPMKEDWICSLWFFSKLEAASLPLSSQSV